MRLVPCAQCHRHVRSDERMCPFCRIRRSLGVSLVVASTLIASPALAEDAGLDASTDPPRDWERQVVPLYGMPPEPRSSCMCDLPASPPPPAAIAATFALVAAAVARRRRPR